MNSVRYDLIVFLVVLAGMNFCSCKNFSKKPDLKKAELAEMKGNFLEAFTFFADALIASTPVLKLPDINRSKFLKPQLWQKEIENYLNWLNTSEEKVPELFKQSLDGVIEHHNNLTLDNRLLHFKSTRLENGAFTREWNKTFFTPTVKVDPAHNEPRKNSISKNSSFLRITSPKNYSYVINLLDPVRKRRVEAQLFPESDVTFMVVPGEYYFLCKSTVTFESGQVWISPFSVTRITIPEKSSLVTANLITSVSR